MSILTEKYYKRYEQKHKWVPRFEYSAPIIQLMMGGIASLFSGLVWVPLDVICARLQIQGGNFISPYSYKNGRDAIRQIWRQDGLRGFYRAYGSAMVVDVPSSAITWMTYQQLKYFLLRLYEKYDGKLGPLGSYQSHFIATISGFVAGAIAAATTNPIQVVTIRMQVQSRTKLKYKNGAHTLGLIIKEEGAIALSNGLMARVLKQAPAVGFGFSCFEFVKTFSKKN